MKKFNLVLSGLIIFSAALVTAQTDRAAKRITTLEHQLEADQNNCKIMMELGKLYQNRAAVGDKKSVKQAVNVFKKLVKIDPDNARAQSWYGSTLTLKGRDALLPLMKLKHVNSGLKRMDKAVELAPDDIEVRSIRANTSISLPGLFGRLECGISDFEYLLNLYEKDSTVYSVGYLAEFNLNLGKAYKKQGDVVQARKHWQQVLKVLPDSHMGKNAAALLDETKE